MGSKVKDVSFFGHDPDRNKIAIFLLYPAGEPDSLNPKILLT
jgi:hypothetical protein